MKLPNRERAEVPSAKLTEYLLSPTHPVGRFKARFFRSLGFDETNLTMLKDGFLAIARNEEVETTLESAYGTKYVIDGELATPAGGRARIRTVWIIERDGIQPQLVTAYPT